MTTFAIDTHRAIERLEAKGFDRHQAEGIVQTLTDSELASTSTVREAMSELKADLYKAMLIQTGATVGILAGLYSMFG